MGLKFTALVVNGWVLLISEVIGVHPCSCNSPNFPGPHTQITNTVDMALFQTCITRWVGRGWVGIKCVPNLHVSIRPARCKRSQLYIYLFRQI